MDRHKMLKSYSEIKKLTMQANREVQKAHVPTRKYTSIKNDQVKCDEVYEDGFQNRNYIKIYKKAN